MNSKKTLLHEAIDFNIANNNFSLRKVWADIEKRIIILALVKEEGDIIRSSFILGITFSTLRSKINKFKIQHLAMN